MDNKITIKRLAKIDEISLLELNSLFDKGTVWDNEQGKKFLENKDNAFFLAFWESRRVGFLTAHRLQRFDKRKAEILLYEIGVSEDFRQKGVGKSLIETVKNWGKEVGADEVWVLTNKSNTAANVLYQSQGGVTENPDDVMYIFKI